jgi:hypothetical protein
MTIFVKVAKQLIYRILAKYIKDSEHADDADKKAVIPHRTPVLSKAQRQMTLELLKKLIDHDYQKFANDKESLAFIKEEIGKADTAVEELRKISRPKRGRGSLNSTLSALNTNLDRVFNLLCIHEEKEKEKQQQKEKQKQKKEEQKEQSEKEKEEQRLKFFDVEDTDDPFTILLCHSIYYLAEERICPVETNVFIYAISKAWSFWNGTSDVGIRQAKEECLIKNLVLCKETLIGFDKTTDNYQALRKRHVNLAIENIFRENLAICEESSPVEIPVNVTVGLSVNIKLPKMRPSRGRLKTALQNAQTEIAGYIEEHQSEHLVTL